MGLPQETDVIIVGGGPCGLMLANELGRRGIRAVLVDEKASTAFNPQANATQARTMEHYRRLGFAHEVRALGLPPEYPTDIAYFTRYTGYELARFRLPSAREATEAVRTMSGSWSASELPHRVSQKYVEQVLRRHAEALEPISVNFGWRLTSFEDTGSHVEAEVERAGDGVAARIRGSYLVGADGPRSLVRRTLGYKYTGETGVRRDFFGGRMYAIYLRAPQFYDVMPHAPAWMYCAFNAQRRTFMATVDGRQEFAFHTQLKPGEDEHAVSEARAREMFAQAMGCPLDIEILSRDSWTAGHALVAERFGRGRVFIGGDAAHLFTPAGGLGYNTAIEDAVNLGWKLAAVIKGTSPKRLLETYEAERQPVARRNTGYARRFADNLGNFKPHPDLEAEGPAGDVSRQIAGDHLNAHIRMEFNIPGITFGGRYDGSPVVVSDGTKPPPDAAEVYVPTACPGGRTPHLWLDDGQSLFDTFGFEWTLLRLGEGAPEGASFATAARRLGIELKVVEVHMPKARELYETDLALVRPDQVVAWRGSDATQAEAVLARATGWSCTGRGAKVRKLA